MQKKTVFFLINSMHGGGAEKVVANLTLALENQYNVYVLQLGPQTDIDYQCGGKIIVLDDGEKRNRISQFLYYKKRIEYFADVYGADVIVSFLLNACLCNIISNTHAKKILSIRNYLKKQFQGKKLFFWENCFKYLFKKSDLIVSVSRAMEDDLINEYGINKEKSKVIYNPYYINKLLESAKEQVENEYTTLFSHEVIVNLGSLHTQKGQCHLIRAFPLVKSEVPNAKLVIIGKGNSNRKIESNLRELVADLNLEEEVVFLGHQSNPHKYLSKSKVFAFPSLYEGFPNALVEAMICGLPVVSSDCETGPREILAPNTHYSKKTSAVEESEYGIIVPTSTEQWLNADIPVTEEEKNLANALISLLTNQEKQDKYRKASKKRAEEFSIEKIIEDWQVILD